MTKLKIIAIAFMFLNTSLCLCLDSAGFYVKNATSSVLKMISKSDFIKFANGIPKQDEIQIETAITKSFRLVFEKNIPSPQMIDVMNGDILLFRIKVSVIGGEPVLDIVDSNPAVKQGLYVPSMGGGYNFVLAVGSDIPSVSADSVNILQPGGVLPYQHSMPIKKDEGSIELNIYDL
jgi:hypothetical protein